ncbi:EAL domain-containing protein [Nostoc sp.]
MDVIAEGVETKEQLAFMNKLKCEYGQGYFSRVR